MFGWLGELLWDGVSTLGSVLFVLAAGLGLFLLVIGWPYFLGVRRKRKAIERAVSAMPPGLRSEIEALSRGLGGFPEGSAVLAAASGELIRHLAAAGAPPDEIIERVLASEAPVTEEPAELQ